MKTLVIIPLVIALFGSSALQAQDQTRDQVRQQLKDCEGVASQECDKLRERERVQTRDQIRQQLKDCDGVASQECDKLREQERVRERAQKKILDRSKDSSGSSGGSGKN